MIVCEIFDWKNRCSQATLVRTTGTLSWSQRCTAHFFRACSRSHTAPGVPMMQDAPAFTPHLDVPGTFNSYYSKCFLFRIFFTYHFPWPKGQEHVHHKNHPIETLLTYFIFFERNNFPIDSSIGGFTDATAKVWFVCMFWVASKSRRFIRFPILKCHVAGIHSIFRHTQISLRWLQTHITLTFHTIPMSIPWNHVWNIPVILLMSICIPSFTYDSSKKSIPPIKNDD